MGNKEIKVRVMNGEKLLATTYIGYEYIPDDDTDILEFCRKCLDECYQQYEIKIEE